MQRSFFLSVLAGTVLALGMAAAPAISHASPEVTLTVLDPRAQRWAPEARPIQPRLKTLAGKKIAIVNNTKPGASYIRPHIIEVLKEKYPDIEFKEFVISYNAYPKKTEDLKAVSIWADAVVGMLGD